MPRGGLRPNAGRKKANHTIEAEALKAYWISEYVKRKAEIVKATLDKAAAGDVPAIKEANERAMGKVKENIDLTSKGEKITAINYIVPRNGDNPQAHTETAPGEPGTERPAS